MGRVEREKGKGKGERGKGKGEGVVSVGLMADTWSLTADS
jgi:hypothetical protein